MKLNIAIIDTGRNKILPVNCLDLNNIETETISVDNLSDYLINQRKELYRHDSYER